MYRVVEDLVDAVERRGDVEALLEDLLAATEECIQADAAASASAAAAAAAADDLAAKSRRPVSELRMLFANPGGGGAPASTPKSIPTVATPRGVGSAAKRATQTGRAVPSADSTTSASRIARGGSRRAVGGGGGEGAGKPAGVGAGVGAGSGGGAAAGRLGVPKRSGLSSAAAAAAGGEDRVSPRRSSDPTGRSKAIPGSSNAGVRGGDSHPIDGLSAVTRRRLRGVGSSSGGLVSPRAAAGDTSGTKKNASIGGGHNSSNSRDMNSAARRARFARQRSRSLSTSPTPRGRGGGGSSPSTSPRPAPSMVAAMSKSRGRASRPPPLFDPSRSDGVGVWGAAARGRTPSGSPRAVAPSSPRSSIGFSRSPSPHRAGGIPRPYGRGGGGGGGGSVTSSASRVVSPRALRQSVDRAQNSPALSVASSESSVVGWEKRESSARGGGGGVGSVSTGGGGSGSGARVGGTLSEPAIEAAALSFMLRNHDKGGSEGAKGGSIAEGISEGGKEGVGTVGVDGASPSRRSSRATSFDSVGDVVVVGGLALGNHRSLPGDALGNDDWLQSQPGTPTMSQVC